MRDGYCSKIANHYSARWLTPPIHIPFRAGSISELPGGFAVLAFAPHGNRKMWTYATGCMSQEDDTEPLELHIFCAERDDSIAELLTATAHYHRTGHRLAIWDTVNFGRPWPVSSLCDHGLLSLPYLDGPALEWFSLEGSRIRFLWMIPVTRMEVAFARKEGIEKLEERFESSKFNYLDISRLSLSCLALWVVACSNWYSFPVDHRRHAGYAAHGMNYDTSPPKGSCGGT